MGFLSKRFDLLNGWQRLWVVCSLLSLLVTLPLILTFARPVDQNEDFDHHLMKVKEAGTQVEIDTVGVVVFPASLSHDEIARYVKQGMATTPSTVQSRAAALLELEAWRLVGIARTQNSSTRSDNRFVWGLGTFGWFAFSLLLYAGGWSIGWVRRGFNR
jgi:hypothetical protein